MRRVGGFYIRPCKNAAGEHSSPLYVSINLVNESLSYFVGMYGTTTNLWTLYDDTYKILEMSTD